MKKLLITLCLILAPALALATTTNVTGGGSALSSCMNTSPGGTEHICLVQDSATYTGWTQTQSGSSGNWIIARADTGYSPVLSSGISFGSQDYISVEGLYINGGITGSGCTNIKIKDNTIDRNGSSSSNAIEMNCDNILISGNTFIDIDQDAIRQFGDYWIVRDNVCNGCLVGDGDPHMDFWQTYCNGGDTASYSLIEGNIFANNLSGGANAHMGVANSTSSCANPVTNMIFRYNVFYNNASVAWWFDANAQDADTGYNSWYNEVFALAYQGNNSNTVIGYFDGTKYSRGVNVLFYDTLSRSSARGWNWDTGGAQWHNLYYDPGGTITFQELATSEVGAVKNENPQFSNLSATDVSLYESSPAIDAGGPLTYANGSGSSSTTLVVDNAMFFQDGSWISDSAVQGDTIYIRTVARPDVYVDFEQGTDGQAITTTLLNNATHGSGTWVADANGHEVSLNETKTPNATYVNGTWYDDSTGTRSIYYNHDSSSADRSVFNFSSSHSRVTVGLYITVSDFSSSYYDQLDLVEIWSSSGGSGSYGCVFQAYPYNSGGGNPPIVRAHTWSGSAGYGSGMQYTPDQTYWLILDADADADVCTATLYNATTFAQEFTSNVSPASLGSSWASFQFGQYPHNATPVGSTYWDNMMFEFDGDGLIFPTGTAQTATITNVNYATNTITLNTPLTWRDGDEVGLYADSDGTVVYSGLAPDIGASEYGVEVAEDTTPPTISGDPVIDTDGLTVTVNFSETVVTTGYSNTFNLDCSVTGSDIALGSISGSGSSRSFTAASTIQSGETCNLDYTGGADEIEDAAGNDLAQFSDDATDNQS
jgi:hypothetical protein